MNNNIDSAETEGFCFDVGSLVERLRRLEDRRKAKGKRYSLDPVLLSVVLAKLCREDTPYGIADWARYRCEALAAILRLKHKTMPCHNTCRRVLAGAVEVNQLQTIISDCVQEVASGGTSILIAVDGKIMRGTIPTGETRGSIS